MCLNLSVVSTSNKLNLTSSDKSRFVIVRDSNDSVVGYVIGSMHSNITDEELSSSKELFTSLIPDVNNVYVECVTGHWTDMKQGYERTLLEVIDNSQPKKMLLSLKVFQVKLICYLTYTI